MSRQINLYNPALEPRVELFSGRSVLLALLGVLAVSLLISAAVALDARRLAAAEARRAAELAALQSEVTGLAQQVAARRPSPLLQQELASLEAVGAARNAVMATLDSGALGDTRGVSEYFRAFARQTTDGVWLTGLSVAGAGADIVIQGRTVDADLVPAYLGKLRGEQALRGRAFESVTVYRPPGTGPAVPDQRARDAGYLEFRLATSAPDTAVAREIGGAAR
jgi:hypothetical protein